MLARWFVPLRLFHTSTDIVSDIGFSFLAQSTKVNPESNTALRCATQLNQIQTEWHKYETKEDEYYLV